MFLRSKLILCVIGIIALNSDTLTSALDISNKVPSNVVQIMPKDAMLRDKSPLLIHEKDLKTDSTITHPSEPAPEFYRGVSASDSLRDRTYDGARYGTTSDYTQKGGWQSLDKDALYRNPYIANAYSKLTGGSTATPSVSSLMSPNASYKDRLDLYNHPSANDYLNSKYGNYGSSNYGTYQGGAPYGPPQALDYNGGYGGSSTGYESIYGSRPSYGQNSILGDNNFGFGGKYPDHHSGDFISSKVRNMKDCKVDR